MRVVPFFTLVCGIASVSAFPTAANVANLARAGGLDITNDLRYEDILEQLKRQREKRLLINTLDSPIKGRCRYTVEEPAEMC